MIQGLKKHRILLLVLILSAVLRIIFLVKDQSFGWDEAVYLSMADAFRGNLYFFEYFRPPLLPFLLSFIPADLLAAKAFSLVLSLASIAAVYYFLNRIAGRGAAIFGAFLLGINYFSLFYSAKALTETMSVLFISVSLFSFYLAWDGKARSPFRHYAVSGVFFALAMMSKHLNAYLFFVFIPLLLYRYRAGFVLRKETWSFLLPAIIALSPWLSFNSFMFGNPFWPQLANAGMSPPEPFYYYILQLPSFAFVQGLLALPALFSIKKDRFARFNLFVILVGMLILSIFAHKEERFLVIILPPLIALEAIGLAKLIKSPGRKAAAAMALAMLLLAAFFIQTLPERRESLLYECAGEIRKLPSANVSTTMSPYFSFLLRREFSQLPWEASEFSCDDLRRRGDYTVFYGLGWFQPLEKEFLERTKECTELVFNRTAWQSCLILKVR